MDGYFYLTFNCRNSEETYLHELNVSVACSCNITGSYEILTKEKALSKPAYDRCNDATLFRDDDGSIWMGCNYHSDHHYLLLHRFDPETVSVSESQVVCEIGAEGEWDHAGVLTSKSIKGPWVKSAQNPILGDNDIWERAGHNHSFTGFDGKDYIIFHANPKDLDEPQCESMFILSVEYLPDGTVRVLL